MEAELFGSIFPVIWQELKNVAGKTFDTAGRQVEWRNAARAYRDKLTRRYGVTFILGKGAPVPLEQVFTRVYIWDKPQALHRLTRAELETRFRQGERQYGLTKAEGVAVTQRFDKLFLVGKPGAGKTTFLRWLTTQHAQEYFNTPYLPIFVSLKAMADKFKTLSADHNSVLEYVIQEFSECGFPDARLFVTTLLVKGKALLLLDGLDEVQSDTGEQKRVIRDVEDFVNQYDQNRYLITCRVAAVSHRFEHFTYAEIADFDDDQIDTYISHYFEQDTDKAAACITALRDPVQKSLRDLARSPLLLSLLCLHFEATTTFPAHRIELYEEGLNALLVQWDQARSISRDEPYQQLSLRRKRQLYTRLAYENFNKGQYFVDTKVMAGQTREFLLRLPNVTADEVAEEEILKAMETQHGVVVERVRGVHAFAHLTFQEYFTALYIVENEAQGTFAELMTHITDPRWREVFLLSASLLEEADTFLMAMGEAIARVPYRNENAPHFWQATLINPGVYNTSDVQARGWGFYLGLSQLVWDSIFNQTLNLARKLALNLARDIVCDITLDGARVRALVLNLNLDLSLARDLDIARNLDLDIALGLDLDIALGLDFDFNRAFDRGRALSGGLALARDLARINPHLGLDCALAWLPLASGTDGESLRAIAMNSARQVGADVLATALEGLSLPTIDISLNDLHAFWRDVRTLGATHRRLPQELILDEAQVAVMNDYLYANELYLRCLEVAAVNNCEAFKARALPLPQDVP